MLADFAITKPTVGGSSGTWGTELNAALDVLIAHPGIKVVADATAKAAYVPLLGQVILQADTGTLYKCTNATGPVWVGVGTASAFTDLTDVPSAYTGAGGKVVAVKADMSGLEFIDAPSGSGAVSSNWGAL